MADVSLRHRAFAPLDLVGFAAGFGLFVFNLWKHRFFESDDAYISLRYARNLVEHGQLVWNLGEYHKGYTNFLHILMTSGLMLLGVEAMTAARTINFAAALMLFLVLMIGVARISPGRDVAPFRALAFISVGATPALAIWVLGGLEAVLVAALLGAGTLGLLYILLDGLKLSNAALTAVSFSLAILTRMDMAPFIVFSGIAVLIYLKDTIRSRLITAIIIIGMPGLVSLTHMAWRFSYYGDILPLTFYAKIGVDFGVRVSSLGTYLMMSSIWAPFITICIAVFVFAAFLSRVSVLRALAIPLGAQLAYIVWSGADHMVGARVLIPLLVPLTIFTIGFTIRIQRNTCILFWAATVGWTALVILTTPPMKMDGGSFVGGIVGPYMKNNWQDGSLVALHIAGAQPYAADNLIFIDMLGLTDPVIAKRKNIPILTPIQLIPGHSKGDAEYVLSREPDYIIAGTTKGRDVNDPLFLTDAELAMSEEFAECYAKREVEIPYSDELAKRGPPRRRPLLFTYYERTCADG